MKNKASKELKYRRIILKLSGEEFTGNEKFGIDPKVLDEIALEIAQLIGIGVEIGVVMGGGNLFRGHSLSKAGLGRVTGDHMGMLATVMNSLAMRDALERININCHLMSAIPISGIVEHYDHRLAMKYLRNKEVIIFSAGTGNPFFTTDSAACLRGIEVEAGIVLKATKVDGVYDKDPKIHSDAVKFEHLTFDQVLEKKLGIMDLTAICLCRDYAMPLRVFKMTKKGSLLNIIVGKVEGTLIESQEEK